VFQPLADAAETFAVARDRYAYAVKARANEAATDALYEAVTTANQILVFLGLIPAYACGECANCKANAAHAADAVHLSDDEDETARRLLGSVDFGFTAEESE
jgi:hypothetical protein